MLYKSALAASMVLWVSQALAKEIPASLQAFYNQVRNGGTCSGPDALATDFFNTEQSGGHTAYCTKYLPLGKGLYLKGPGSDLANMDIDCDGEQSGGDGRCKSSTDTQGQTTFSTNLHKFEIGDLNANIHPYVVLGNEGNYSPTFDPRSVGVQPLSVVAVVCRDQLVYGIWGDTNGDDGEHPMVGEASIALATACFGQEIAGNSGYDGSDVLYLAFTGTEAVPGAKAKWKAKTYEEFETSITKLGDRLVADLFGDTSEESSDTSEHHNGDNDGKHQKSTACSRLPNLALLMWIVPIVVWFSFVI
ncbi:glycoside hydrolase family 75 protein [Aspergillus clavatus NRRL 1]|uniref:Endo-chitosanase n=1 Tax=Aspergillus clavatus (strain ATCC 1007 / CBS 513.65 / DSM 816 / NCTC 3887 / NRRL 1 / QM 1276 / 107) TaxID=344612 RepID=A1CN44_ASPCL|nr:chitosanase, putative [Aspergillus clavatus NRRL 1]EAW08981.1 chitosanase, putative [Aspergillus clavatus NRRL 1]